MPLVRINAIAGELALHDTGKSALPLLAAARCGEGPVIVMVHGFKYDPLNPTHCPHDTLFGGDAPHGWARQLGFGGGARAGRVDARHTARCYPRGHRATMVAPATCTEHACGPRQNPHHGWQ